MKAIHPSRNAPAVTPEMALRFGAIIAGLVAVVARRFLREPRLVGLILPLCRWFARAAQRFARVTAGPVVVRASRAGRSGGGVTRAVRLPSQRAWLLRELQHEAVAYRGYLEQLLAEPAMRAALEAAPALGRLLRPLCHMLGIEKAVVTVAPGAAVAESAPATVAATVGPSPEFPTSDRVVRADTTLIRPVFFATMI